MAKFQNLDMNYLTGIAERLRAEREEAQRKVEAERLRKEQAERLKREQQEALKRAQEERLAREQEEARLKREQQAQGRQFSPPIRYGPEISEKTKPTSIFPLIKYFLPSEETNDKHIEMSIKKIKSESDSKLENPYMIFPKISESKRYKGLIEKISENERDNN